MDFQLAEFLKTDLRAVVRRFHRDERGATATEYVVLLVLIACFIIAIVALYGDTLHRRWQMAVEVVRKFVRLN